MYCFDLLCVNLFWLDASVQGPFSPFKIPSTSDQCGIILVTVLRYVHQSCTAAKALADPQIMFFWSLNLISQRAFKIYFGSLGDKIKGAKCQSEDCESPTIIGG